MTKKYFLPEYTMKILEATGWTQSELATHAKLSRTAINDVINGKAKGGYKYAIAIAEAANRPLEEALQAAGLLPLDPDSDPLTKEGLHILQQLEGEEKKDAIRYLNMRLSVQEEREKKNVKRTKEKPSTP
jgi:transcriptional regulator with XRE-family HTH domain